MALRFHVPPQDELPIDLERRVVLADFEGGLWPCHVTLGDRLLTVIADTDDSGCVMLPWLMPDGSELMLSTGTLVQRQRPYSMSLELARGTLYRITNELSAWQLGGQEASPSLLAKVSAVKQIFASAVTHQWARDAAVQGRLVLEAAVQTLEELAGCITQSLLDQQSGEPNSPAPLRGCRLPAGNPPLQTTKFRSAFDTAVAGFTWRGVEPEPGVFQWELVDRQLQWCQQLGLRSVAGPLISLHSRRSPDWLYLFEDSKEQIINHALGFVEQITQRCAGRVNLWYASSGLNAVGSIGLSEESRLKLAAESVQIIRQIDRQTPIMVGFEQPWGEYLARSSDDLSPLGFADILVRSKLGIAAIALELNFDVWPNGTVRRDAFEFLHQIDQWARLQLPLIIMLSAPSETEIDEGMKNCRCTGAVVTPAKQADLLREVLPLLRIHRSVQGVVWNQWSDAPESDIPATGMIDRSGNAKPALAVWTETK